MRRRSRSGSFNTGSSRKSKDKYIFLCGRRAEETLTRAAESVRACRDASAALNAPTTGELSNAPSWRGFDGETFADARYSGFLALNPERGMVDPWRRIRTRSDRPRPTSPSCQPKRRRPRSRPRRPSSAPRSSAFAGCRSPRGTDSVSSSLADAGGEHRLPEEGCAAREGERGLLPAFALES